MRHRQQKHQSKPQSLRLQIRSRQITQLFSLTRHNLPTDLTKQQLESMYKNNINQLQQKLTNIQQNTQPPFSTSSNSNYAWNTYAQLKQKQLGNYTCLKGIENYSWGDNVIGSYRMQVLIKELRDFCCQGQLGCCWGEARVVRVFDKLQKCHNIDRQSMEYLYQILLNLSAMIQPPQKCPKCTNPHTPLTPSHLSLPLAFSSPNPYIITLTLQILSNWLQKDETSQTLYNYITKQKIVQYLLKLIIDNKQLYIVNRQKIEKTYLWFVNKFINKVMRYRFENIVIDWGNLVAVFCGQVVRVLGEVEAKGEQREDEEGVGIQDVLACFKTLIKVEAIDLTQQLIQRIEKYFNPTNPYYLDFIGTLICRTLYSLPLSHLQSLLKQLMQHPQNQFNSRQLRNISNSLINDSTNWRMVLQHFIQYSNTSRPPSLLSSYPQQNLFEQNRTCIPSFLSFFFHFLNRSQTESDMVEIIGVIICGQGGLGVFEDGVEMLVESQAMRKKLQSFGYQVQ